MLNQWNRLTLYRHRWDAWIQLNNGKHVEGRSKVCFVTKVNVLVRLSLMNVLHELETYGGSVTVNSTAVR